MFKGLARAVLLAGVLGTAARGDNVVIDWSKATLQAIRTTHPGPPMVARMLAIVHTCAYDAWAAYSEDAIGTRLGGSLRRPEEERTQANRIAAVATAAHRCAVDLFPSQQAALDATLVAEGFDPANISIDPATGPGVGNLAAQAVLDFRHHDGANQLGDLAPGPYSDYTGYAPVNTPDLINDPLRWQPLRVSDGHGGTVVQRYIAPHWAFVTPYALLSASQFLPPPPEPLGAAYDLQISQVLDYSAHLDDRSKVIAEYWADGPRSELPPGHWSLFAQFVSARDHHTLGQDVKMFFAMQNAILDASIVCWDSKRAYDYVRPVTAVHYRKTGQLVLAWAGAYQGTQLIDGANWRPYQAITVVTPPFPEYFSGHSIFSRAGAETLRLFTGSDSFGGSYTQAAGTSRVEPGAVPAADLTLQWATFTEAADEAGLSRRYGGIHFVEGDLRARATGVLVAQQAWRKSLFYFRGGND